MGAGPLYRYSKLKQDFKTPFKALLHTYKLLKGRVLLETKSGHQIETTKDDLPIWNEYFQPQKVSVAVQDGLFKITPLSKKFESYLVKAGNFKITYQPKRPYPEVYQNELFKRLENSEQKVFSQHGEDGVIQELLKITGVDSKFVIEFGAHDGVKMSNSRHLILNQDWGALLIEADPRMYENLEKVYKGSSQVQTLKTFVTEENINTLFTQAKAPKDFEVLSIDVDTIDYYLWDALTEFEPRIVLIECNPVFPRDVEYVVSKENAFEVGGTRWEGASFKSLVELGKKKNYSLVYVELVGSNLFFVHNKYLKGVTLPSAELMYQPPQFGELTDGPAINGRGYL